MTEPVPPAEAGAADLRRLPETPVPSPDAGRWWPERLGLAADRLLNVLLLDGDDTWTVSLHAAVAARDGRRWGCAACRLLALLVQRDHCALTLDPNAREATGAAVRAGLLILLALGAAAYGAHLALSLL